VGTLDRTRREAAAATAPLEVERERNPSFESPVRTITGVFQTAFDLPVQGLAFVAIDVRDLDIARSDRAIARETHRSRPQRLTFKRLREPGTFVVMRFLMTWRVGSVGFAAL
jgi:hypothetical protein